MPSASVHLSSTNYSSTRISRQRPEFRRAFINNAPHADQLSCVCHLQKEVMHIRIPCPVCYKAEKRGERTRMKALDQDSAVFEAVCFDHGAYEAVITATSTDYLDLSTLYRNVVKEAELADRKNILPVMVKGERWASACHLVGRAYCALGCRHSHSVICVTPHIVNHDGAKLSKRLISRVQMDLPPEEVRWVINTEEYDGDIDDYCDALTGLVAATLSDPKHFFRSYSYKEIDRLMKAQGPDELRGSRARVISIYRKYFDLINSGEYY